MKIRIIIFLLLSLYSNLAFALQIASIKGTLSAIEKPINFVVSKAENLFEQNFGASLASNISMITGDNPFISVLSLETDYKIKIQLAGTLGTPSDTIPVNPRLRGTKILLIPIHEEGDNNINSWECITDADSGSKNYLGSDNTASEGGLSFITDSELVGNNLYISNCSYHRNPF